MLAVQGVTTAPETVVDGPNIRPQHRECVTLLLRAGANADIAQSDGTTALHLASEKGHTDQVQQLIQHGCNLNLPTDDFSTVGELLSWKQIDPFCFTGNTYRSQGKSPESCSTATSGNS